MNALATIINKGFFILLGLSVKSKFRMFSFIYLRSAHSKTMSPIREHIRKIITVLIGSKYTLNYPYPPTGVPDMPFEDPPEVVPPEELLDEDPLPLEPPDDVLMQTLLITILV